MLVVSGGLPGCLSWALKNTERTELPELGQKAEVWVVSLDVSPIIKRTIPSLPRPRTVMTE